MIKNARKVAESFLIGYIARKLSEILTKSLFMFDYYIQNKAKICKKKS